MPWNPRTDYPRAGHPDDVAEIMRELDNDREEQPTMDVTAPKVHEYPYWMPAHDLVSDGLGACTICQDEYAADVESGAFLAIECPNCHDNSPRACALCATFGAHDGPCYHVRAAARR